MLQYGAHALIAGMPISCMLEQPPLLRGCHVIQTSMSKRVIVLVGYRIVDIKVLTTLTYHHSNLRRRGTASSARDASIHALTQPELVSPVEDLKQTSRDCRSQVALYTSLSIYRIVIDAYGFTMVCRFVSVVAETKRTRTIALRKLDAIRKAVR